MSIVEVIKYFEQLVNNDTNSNLIIYSYLVMVILFIAATFDTVKINNMLNKIFVNFELKKQDIYTLFCHLHHILGKINLYTWLVFFFIKPFRLQVIKILFIEYNMGFYLLLGKYFFFKICSYSLKIRFPMKPHFKIIFNLQLISFFFIQLEGVGIESEFTSILLPYIIGVAYLLPHVPLIPKELLLFFSRFKSKIQRWYDRSN